MEKRNEGSPGRFPDEPLIYLPQSDHSPSQGFAMSVMKMCSPPGFGHEVLPYPIYF
jgi:hypothetical protein